MTPQGRRVPSTSQYRAGQWSKLRSGEGAGVFEQQQLFLCVQRYCPSVCFQELQAHACTTLKHFDSNTLVPVVSLPCPVYSRQVLLQMQGYRRISCGRPTCKKPTFRRSAFPVQILCKGAMSADPVAHWHMFLQPWGNVSAPGTRRASFVTRAPPVDSCR